MRVDRRAVDDPGVLGTGRLVHLPTVAGALIMPVDWSQRVVDVSYSQGDCNFTVMAVALAPVTLSGAIVKISEGAEIYDPNALHNVWAMGHAGLRWQMLYHFVRNDPAYAQFNHLRDQIDAWLYGMVDRRCLWLDIENHGPTNTPINIGIATELMHLCSQRWPGRVGWYANRSIAYALTKLDDIYNQIPCWIAAPGTDLDVVATEYGATLVQYGQGPLGGTTKNPDVLFDAVAQPTILDALCAVSAPLPRKAPSMILFQVPNDVYLWDGSAMVGLGGLGSIYDVLGTAGVPTIDATQGEGQAFFERLITTHRPTTLAADAFRQTLARARVDIIID